MVKNSVGHKKFVKELKYIFDDFSSQKYDSNILEKEFSHFYRNDKKYSVIFGERTHMNNLICESMGRDINSLNNLFGVSIFLELIPFLNNTTTIEKPIHFSKLIHKTEFKEKENSEYSNCLLKYIQMGKNFLEKGMDVFVFNDHQGDVWGQNKRMYERVVKFDEELNTNLMVFVLGLKHLIGYRSFQGLISKEYPSLVYIKDDPRMIPPLKEVCIVKKDRETLEYKIN